MCEVAQKFPDDGFQTFVQPSVEQRKCCKTNKSIKSINTKMVKKKKKRKKKKVWCEGVLSAENEPEIRDR